MYEKGNSLLELKTAPEIKNVYMKKVLCSPIFYFYAILRKKVAIKFKMIVISQLVPFLKSCGSIKVDRNILLL